MTNLITPNQQYSDNVSNWRLVRNLIKGESALKRHDLSGLGTIGTHVKSVNNFKLNERYLPIPDTTNCGDENIWRYCQYVQRASLFNATKRTEQGMSGMVFQRRAKVDLPSSIKYLEDDADGSGVGIEQQSQEVLNDVLETGREGLLVDFPETDSSVTMEEAEKLGVRASIVMYKAESIVDWDSIKINAARKLSLVVLMEVCTERDPANIFITEEVTKYRVLMLDENGNYIQRVYTESGSEYTEHMPVDALGMPFDYIPFFFIGSVNNRPTVDPIPLIEISEVNLAHYRNSADFEESEFIVGQPSLVVSGLNQTWADKYMKEGVGFGSRSGMLLPEGGNASLLQAQPNTMPESGMERKEKQMVELGARLIQPGGSAETAEAARIKHAADASVLSVIVANINQAYADALVACQQFMSSTLEDAEFVINTKFFIERMTAEEQAALVASWQQRAISKEVLDDRLVKGGVIPEGTDLEEMNDMILNTPTSINFDDE